MLFSRRRPLPRDVLFPCFCALWLVLGCASPGSPRPPSLQLPELPRTLSASRSGDSVQLRFSLSARTTDGQPFRGKAVRASLCRQETVAGPCRPVDLPQANQPLAVPGGNGAAQQIVHWTDPLPPELRTGPARPLLYRVELRNMEGRSGGWSDPVYTAAGAAPPQVQQLRAEGARLGVLLLWQPVEGSSDVLLERQQVDPPLLAQTVVSQRLTAPDTSSGKGSERQVSRPRDRRATTPEPDTEPGDEWMQAGADPSSQVVDATVSEGVRYRYRAVRRVLVKVGGRSLELRSAPSATVDFTWRDVYPPPAPLELTALGYQAGQPGEALSAGSGYAVDLIWQPVNDPRVTGYVVQRQALSPAGSDEGPLQRLTPVPVAVPGFHDITAAPATAYRYGVMAVDAKGNVSAPALAVVQGR